MLSETDIQIEQLKLAKLTTELLIRDCNRDVQKAILHVFDLHILRLDEQLPKNLKCEDEDDS